MRPRKPARRPSSSRPIRFEQLESRLLLASFPGNSASPNLSLSAVPVQTVQAGSVLSFNLLTAGATVSDSQTAAANIRLVLDPDDTPAGATLGAGGAFSWTPTLAQIGTHQIVVIAVDDGTPFLADAEVFAINVTAPPNSPPTFTLAPSDAVNEDSGARTVPNFASNISPGPSNESGQTVSFTITNNTNTALFSAGPAIASNGTLTYTPAANATGTATVSVRATDNGGTAGGGNDTSATQSFTITVNTVNDAPSFTLAASDAVNEDSGARSVPNFATNIVAGPTSESAQTLTFTVTDNTNAALFSTAPAIASNGTLTYTPAANASGTATITVRLADNGGTANGGVDTSAAQSFTITVTAVNDAPSFTLATNDTVNEDSGARSVPNFASNIVAGPTSESAQTLTFTVTDNTNAALFSTAPAIAPNGTLTYTPAANANGTATITVRLADNGGTANGGVDTSATQSFAITVTAINDAPSFALAASDTVSEDSGARSLPSFATSVLAGPNESAQTVAFSVTDNTNAALFSAGPAIAPNGTLTYTPAANANGTATVTVRLADNGGTANGGVDTSATQSFTITVNPVNDAPDFTLAASDTVNEDVASRSVPSFASGITAGPANESAQTVAFNITDNTNPSLFSVTPAISAGGTLTYTVAPNAFGTATVSVRAVDNGGTADGGVDTSAVKSFTVSVQAVNDAPSFTIPAGHTSAQNGGLQSVANFATNISSGPANENGQVVTFTVTDNTNAALFAVAPAISLAGTLTYTAAAGVAGTATITVVARDDGGTANGGEDASPSQTFTIKINAPPQLTLPAPFNVATPAVIQLGNSVNFLATATDSDGVANGSDLRFTLDLTGSGISAGAAQPTITSPPANVPGGAFSWTPTEVGTFAIRVVVTDADGATDSRTFSVTVNGAPNLVLPAPFAGSNAANPVVITLGNAINFTVTGIDEGPANGLTFALDLDGSGISAGASQPTITTPPTSVPGGDFAWTPNETGLFTIIVLLTDGRGGVDQEAFTVRVNAV